MRAAIVGAVSALIVVWAVMGCTKAQGGAVVTGGIDVALCVLNHSTEPPATIAAECGVAAVEDVVKILDAHRAAAIREAR